MMMVVYGHVHLVDGSSASLRRLAGSRRVLHGLQDAEMLLLQFLEIMLELMVPGVEDEDLEAQGGRRDAEVCQRYDTRDSHYGGM